MSDWNPSIVRIEKIEKHPGADRLIIVTVLGDYPVITNMVDLKVNDLIGYLPIDTICPDTEDFHFLCPMAYESFEDENGNVEKRQVGPRFPVGSVPEKYRILKAKKIRGVYSQGMLHPIEGMHEGDSLVELLGLKKWEEDEEENVHIQKGKGSGPEKAPKGWMIPHYDIDSVRKYLSCLQEGEEIVLTEKLHGCVTKDSMVETLEHGSISIGELQKLVPNVHVKSMNVHTGEITFEKCEKVFENGPADNWYEIQLNNDTKIKITGNHLVWLPKLKCYREVENLEEGDEIFFD